MTRWFENLGNGRKVSRLSLFWISVVGTALALPSLAVELLLDDFVIRGHLLAFLSGQGGGRPWWDAGILLDGNAEVTLFKRHISLLPWWTFPQVRVAFFRPLGVATCLLDYALWPDAVWAMHLHSLLWYGSMCMLAGLLYRRLINDQRVAMLAALFYAVDDLHSTPVAWIANRNTLMAALFGYLALLAHDRWRRQGWSPGVWLELIALVASLLSAEMGVCILGYLLAYSLTLDRAGSRGRLASLVPAALTVVTWRLIYNALGYGSFATGSYLDPVRHPLIFLSELPKRTGWMSAWQFGLPITVLNQLEQRASLWAFRGVLLVIGGGLLWLLVRKAVRDAEIRFWALGTPAALIPLAASIPGERLLLISGLGASALLAHLIVFAVDAWRNSHALLVRVMSGFLAGVVFIVHLVVASIYLCLDSYNVGRDFINMGFSHAPMLGDDPSLDFHDLVVVNAPNCLHGMIIRHERIKRGLHGPARVWILGSGPRRRVVSRTGADSLELVADNGYLLDPFAAHFRGPGHPLRRGEKIRLLNHTITVREVTDDGRPLRIRADFDVVLEDANLNFAVWDGRDYIAFELPQIGRKVLIPPWPLGRTDIVRPPRLIKDKPAP